MLKDKNSLSPVHARRHAGYIKVHIVRQHLVPVVGLRVKIGSSKMCCQHGVSAHPATKPDVIAA